MINTFEPTIKSPYVINTTGSAVFRIACSAGVNRSTTIREYIKSKVSKSNIFYQPYGAQYGNYNNSEIICIRTTESDGFAELFGHDKPPSIQASIFDQLNYPVSNHLALQKLNDVDKNKYKNIIMDYWNLFQECDRIPGKEFSHKGNIEPKSKNIFIIINDDKNVIENVRNELSKTNKSVDLVILNIPDIIYYPIDSKIKPQSLEAYQYFIQIASQLFEFI